MNTIFDSGQSGETLAKQIKQWGKDLGFQQVGIADTKLDQEERHLAVWIEKGFHGEMEYMQRHGLKRSRPELLMAGTIRVISVRMDYLPEAQKKINDTLENPVTAFISRYALGRDYHKIMRKRLQKLAEKIQQSAGKYGYRVFVDSAPVMEKALAEKAGLGWIGKHTNVIDRKAGSWFFLGEIYTDLPLPVDNTGTNHCGDCTACIDICPTRAIVAPYQVDARRCISYLTIELKNSIPEELRPMIGNRIYGCDDCQLVCPWNRFARLTDEPDFAPRHQLNSSELLELFNWSEEEFLSKTEGSAIRRIGYECWLRNIAIALGNAPASQKIKDKLQSMAACPSKMVREHVIWALRRQVNAGKALIP